MTPIDEKIKKGNGRMKSKISTFIYVSENWNWIPSIEKVLSVNNFSFCKIKQSLLVWNPQEISRAKNGVHFVDGGIVKSIYLGKSSIKKTISLSPKRFYFKHKEDIPTTAIEYTLFENSLPPYTSPIVKLEATIKIEEIIKSYPNFTKLDNILQPHCKSIINQTTAVNYLGVNYPLKDDLWTSIVKNGVASAPSMFTIHTIYDESIVAGMQFFDEYKNILKTKWRQIDPLSRDLKITATPINEALLKIQDYKKLQLKFQKNSVFLIGLKGKIGDQLPKKQSELMDLLDNLKQPYRLCSVDNKQLFYSASSQILSLLIGAGGNPYKLNLPIPKMFENGVFFGIDIGHDKKNKESVIAISVLNSHGKHIITITKKMPLNESIRSIDIKNLLQKANNEAEKILRSKITKAIIIRDGRITDSGKKRCHEKVYDYINSIDATCSLVELRKRGNPPLFEIDNNSVIVNSGLVFATDENVRFANFYNSKIGLPKTFKISIPDGGDVFGWGIDTYVEILGGLCYSPSLGLQPHLPGPIYWADGIANTSKTDNRFRGQTSVKVLN